MEKVATASAADAEGSAPPARLHLPRRILSLWQEPDAATRAKLLLAFAMSDAFSASDLPEAWSRLNTQFTETWAHLDEPARANVRSFLDWCDRESGVASVKLAAVRGLLPK